MIEFIPITLWLKCTLYANEMVLKIQLSFCLCII